MFQQQTNLSSLDMAHNVWICVVRNEVLLLWRRNSSLDGTITDTFMFDSVIVDVSSISCRCSSAFGGIVIIVGNFDAIIIYLVTIILLR